MSCSHNMFHGFKTFHHWSWDHQRRHFWLVSDYYKSEYTEKHKPYSIISTVSVFKGCCCCFSSLPVTLSAPSPLPELKRVDVPLKISMHPSKCPVLYINVYSLFIYFWRADVDLSLHTGIYPATDCWQSLQISLSYWRICSNCEFSLHKYSQMYSPACIYLLHTFSMNIFAFDVIRGWQQGYFAKTRYIFMYVCDIGLLCGKHWYKIIQTLSWSRVTLSRHVEFFVFVNVPLILDLLGVYIISCIFPIKYIQSYSWLLSVYLTCVVVYVSCLSCLAFTLPVLFWVVLCHSPQLFPLPLITPLCTYCLTLLSFVTLLLQCFVSPVLSSVSFTVLC